MNIIEKSAGQYIILHHGANIGTVALSHNPYHQTNCYVKLDLNHFDPNWSSELSAQLKETAGSPLQAMVSSDDVALTAFLTAGGWICKRKCYEVEARLEDYIGESRNIPLRCATAGDSQYKHACRLMYAYYVAAHEKINPWTGDEKAFCRELPETVFYAENASDIIACAFVEGNEIAYVYGKDSNHFTEFAQTLVPFMLSHNETICFESDDCDWVAMTLRSLFQNLDDSSYDTYLYDN